MASNQNYLEVLIGETVQQELQDQGFKLFSPGGFLDFSKASRTLDIEISSLRFSYSPDGKTITATCVINLKAAAGTFDHMSQTYSASTSISNSPAATQSAVIQAVGQALSQALQKMMSDQQLIQFIS